MKGLWLIFQIIIAAILLFPLLLLVVSFFTKLITKKRKIDADFESDFGIIVTAYKHVDLLEDIVKSILRSNYKQYIIYIVADGCDVSSLNFNNDKVIVLRPETLLSSNIRSHFYAIERFIREHNVITIFDSDNLVDENYFDVINSFVKQGFNAVQGVRKARNLNSVYACLDEAGDIFYRFIDRKLLYESGSSSSLAGSGMAFKAMLYKSALNDICISGAGFDKVLQYELVIKNEIIAFAEKAIVYDGKTSKSDQLVKQRARWINTWFKYWVLGIKLLIKSLVAFSWNQFAFAIMLLRPPLFLLFFIIFIVTVLNIFLTPAYLVLWVISFFVFLSIFMISLYYFKADRKIFKALLQIPKFIFYQFQALLKANVANEISVATTHDADLYKKNS